MLSSLFWAGVSVEEEKCFFSPNKPELPCFRDVADEAAESVDCELTGEEKADVPSLPIVNFRSIPVPVVPGPICFFSARSELNAETVEVAVCDRMVAVVPMGATVVVLGLVSSDAVLTDDTVAFVEGDDLGDFIGRALEPAAIITPCCCDGTVGSSLLLPPETADGDVPKAAFTGVIKELVLERPLDEDGGVLLSSDSPAFDRTESEGDVPAD